MIDKPEVLFAQHEIAARVRQIGGEVTAALGDSEVCVVGLMKSCMVFMADLIREIPLDTTCHFLRAASFTDAGDDAHAARTDIVYSTEIPYTGKHILLIEDVVDTGITLRFLVDHIQDRRPKSLRVVTLIDKPAARKIDVHPDWSAFTLTEPIEGFLVGYGLDWGERYRGLPYIGTIPRPAALPEGVPARTLEKDASGT